MVIDAAPYFGNPNSTWRSSTTWILCPMSRSRPTRTSLQSNAAAPNAVNLWRIFGYLAVVTVYSDKLFGRRILSSLADAVRIYIKR